MADMLPVSASGELPSLSAARRSLTDEELARNVQRGCEASFAELDRRCRDWLVHLVGRRLADRHDAEDVAQLTLWRAYDRIEQFDPRRCFRNWLSGIARNLTTDHQRTTALGRRRRAEAVDEFVDGLPQAEAQAVDQELRLVLWRLAAQVLNAEQQAVLRLHYQQGLTPREIAQATGRSQVGVRVALFRARKALLPHLARQEDFAGPPSSTADRGHAEGDR
jgi:RNA polymerase sigma-70 factor (ECF subfamily)